MRIYKVRCHCERSEAISCDQLSSRDRHVVPTGVGTPRDDRSIQSLARRICLFVIFAFLVANSAFAANRIVQLSAAKGASFVPPKVKSVVLKNGMRCFLLEDRSLPIVEGKLLIKGGRIYEDKGDKGATSLMMGMLKEGGTVSKTPDEVREFLDKNAIDIKFSSSDEMLEGQVEALSKDMDKAFSLLFEMVFEPRFDEGAFTTVRKRTAEGVKRELEVVGAIANREFLKEVYGKDSPWADRATEKSVLRLKKDDIVKYYDRFVSPDRMILAVSGDFKTAELIKELETITEKYRPKELTVLHTPEVCNGERPPQTKFVKKNFAQSAVYAGHLGTTRDDPNKYALVIMNHILGGGGGFTSRLQDVIRVKGGLAYEVWSSFSFGPKGAPGVFAVHVKTRNKTVEKAIELIEQEVEKLHDGGVKPEEFKLAREGILNSIIFDYERPFNIVSAVARFVYLGLPEDYIEVYRKKIEGVKIEDVNAVAKEYLHPEEFKIAVVGGK